MSCNECLNEPLVKPTEVRVSQLTPVLVADKEAVLECSTFGSRPKAVIYWNFDGQRFNTPLNGKYSCEDVRVNSSNEHSYKSILTRLIYSLIPNSPLSPFLNGQWEHWVNIKRVLQLPSPPVRNTMEPKWPVSLRIPRLLPLASQTISGWMFSVCIIQEFFPPLLFPFLLLFFFAAEDKELFLFVLIATHHKFSSSADSF